MDRSALLPSRWTPSPEASGLQEGTQSWSKTSGSTYRITQARAEEFRRNLAQSEDEHRTSTLHPKLKQAKLDALRSQLQTLERELREYEELRSGKPESLTYASFEELPKALVQARIARGWTQKELADRLGLGEQKIQDYEATGYQRASLAWITEIVRRRRSRSERK